MSWSWYWSLSVCWSCFGFYPDLKLDLDINFDLKTKSNGTFIFISGLILILNNLYHVINFHLDLTFSLGLDLSGSWSDFSVWIPVWSWSRIWFSSQLKYNLNMNLGLWHQFGLDLNFDTVEGMTPKQAPP